MLAVAAVAGLILSWGVAQWPYLLPETLTVQEAAAPTGTLGALVVAVVLALLLVLPGFLHPVRRSYSTRCCPTRESRTWATGRSGSPAA